MKFLCVSRAPLDGHIFMWLVIFCKKLSCIFLPWVMKPTRTIHARESGLFANMKDSRPKDCQKILLDMLNQSSCNRVDGTLSCTPTHPATAATAHAYLDAVILYFSPHLSACSDAPSCIDHPHLKQSAHVTVIPS